MNTTIEKYQVLTLESWDCKVEKFNELVQDYINDNWQPTGGVQVIPMKMGDSDGVVFFQSITRHY